MYLLLIMLDRFTGCCFFPLYLCFICDTKTVQIRKSDKFIDFFYNINYVCIVDCVVLKMQVMHEITECCRLYVFC